MSNKQSTILAFNTVERLLKGDFFHFSTAADITKELNNFNNKWPVIGLGTTNWYKRNGEAIVEGMSENPLFLWADPESSPPGKLINLNHEHPIHEESLQSPFIGAEDTIAQFPFMAIALCDPNELQKYTLSSGEVIHEWLEEKFISENLGLAAIHIKGKLDGVKTTTACHIPIGGVDLNDGYSLESSFKFIEYKTGNWSMQGLYGVNPTIQQILSIPGHPLHLHGYEVDNNRGGHINQAFSTSTTHITVYPIRNINISIKGLDKALLPVKPLQ